MVGGARPLRADRGLYGQFAFNVATVFLVGVDVSHMKRGFLCMAYQFYKCDPDKDRALGLVYSMDR